VDIGARRRSDHCPLPPHGPGRDSVDRLTAMAIANIILKERSLFFSKREAGQIDSVFITILLIKPRSIVGFAARDFSIAPEYEWQYLCRTLVAVDAFLPLRERAVA